MALRLPQQQSIVWEGSEGRSAVHWGQEDSSCLPRSLPSPGHPCARGERVSAPRSAARLPELDFACSALFVREPFHHRSVLFSELVSSPFSILGKKNPKKTQTKKSPLEEGLGNKAMCFSSMLCILYKLKGFSSCGLFSADIS